MIRMKSIQENINIIQKAEQLLSQYKAYHFIKKEGFLDKIVYNERDDSRIAEYKVSNGKEVLFIYPEFLSYYNRYGEDWAEEVLLHELGHAFLDWYGMSTLMDKGYDYGIDVFDTSQLPFGEGNFHEAFGQMFSLILKNEYSAKKQYPKWWSLVYDILESKGIV